MNLSQSRLVLAGLGLVVVVLGGLIARDIFLPQRQAASGVRLATVTRGTVKAAVSGTGAVEPAGQLNLNFRTQGVISELDVRVGDHVTAGQVLARLDPQAQQNTLDASNAGVQAAEANLQAAETPLTAAQVAQLQHNVNAARIAYNDTVASVNLTNQQDANQVAADQNQYNQDKAAYDSNPKDQADLQKLQADQNQLAMYEAKYRADQNQYNADQCYQPSPPNPPACAADQAALTTDQNNINAQQQVVNQDQQAVNQDRAPLNQDQAKLATDQAKQQADQVAGQARIDQSAAAITSAQDALATQTQLKPNTVASAQAQLASAQAQAAAAALAVNETTLTAPADGVVAALNGQVGEAVSAGAGTTQQAPGSAAPQPAAGSTSATGTSGGSSSFLVLSSDSGLEAVVPFAETDAARLKTGAETSVTFDAVPDLTITGHVLAIGVNASVVSNVVDYYATVVLNRSDPRLKAGMTANASAIVAEADNVLTVPNTAIRRSGTSTTVLVYSNGQQVSTDVDVGITGDTSTEIKAGLQEGDQVVLPQLRTSTGSTTQRGAGGAGGLGIPGAGRGG